MTGTHRFDTLAAHAGVAPDPASGALSPPLQLATTFEHTPDVGTPLGYLYQRYGSPNQAQLEQVLATLDGAARAMFFATGMTAGTTAMQALPPGSELLIADDTYFGYRAVGEKWLQRWGVRHRVVDMTDLDAVRAAITPDTRLLWAETPSNPLLQVCDIAALADIAHGAGARLLVDGTFATPALQQPLALGADIVLHSATKYLGGHGDVVAGIVVTGDEWARRIRRVRVATGGILHPLAAYLLHRGLGTLPLRVERAQATAQELAVRLGEAPGVVRVHFPGLPGADPAGLVGRQMSGPGSVLAFELEGGYAAAAACMEAMRLATPAVSLGSLDTLVQHPAGLTHHVVPPEIRRESGISDGMLRLSGGLEDVEDLWDDLRVGLDAAADSVRRMSRRSEYAGKE